ncbi:Ephrin type-A receptor 4 like protein [Argiope bruennichi]|uniref:Ephrin type-A receptor 4 like protein n=1 Tax=Argiope bruennichi TaxID=94029 RepID=A0A8T0FPV2_ARGBR|nr:Ephrin type-A receptor 4 like protein [Argiope bruennichi]
MAVDCKECIQIFPVLLLIFTCCSPTTAKQVVLLDTTQESSLEWTRYPYGPQARTPGWVEESFTNFEQGINWRSYVVCDVAYNSVNNWLWTPFIERREANRMYIEVKFSMRDCNLFPGMALSCKETFSLLYYEFDAATKEPPPWEPDSYKLIDRIAADEGRFTSTSEVIINTEVRSVPITKKGVYFAFRDQGACLSLIAIKVYYITCPSVTLNFAYFPETPTGHELPAIVSAEGQCVANTAVVDTPRLLCKGDGNWTLPSGGCKCVAGYEPVDQSCQLCSMGTYKENVGDELCMPCPLHSTATFTGSVECQCDKNYYRSPKDPKSWPCTEPPSKPLNLSETFVDQSSVLLTWYSPKYLGGRNDTFYKVTCDKCGAGVTYVPSQQGFTDTKVTVTGLSPVTTYTFRIYAENGVSSFTASKYSEITITTEASVPSLVSNVRIKSVKSSEISLEWDAPDDPFSDTENYEVRYYQKGHERNGSTATTTKEEITIPSLKEGTMYGFQVRAKTTHGWGDYSKTVFKTTGAKLATRELVADDQVQVPIIVGVAVTVVAVIVFVIVIIMLYIRRSSDECNKKQPSDCDTLEYRNGEVVPALVHPPIVPTACEFTPLFTQCGASRAYIDPHTYEDPNQAVREFTKEIDASHITIESIIGGGEFGDVCKGRLKLQGQTEVTVAIKTLKPSSSDKARMDFLTEASIMGQFDHPNVIYLQGVVTKSNPVMIITEFMENGSLDTFLRANDGKFQVIQLVGMLRGIAAADFGLSREIESATEGAYTTRGGKIPVRWTAPESHFAYGIHICSVSLEFGHVFGKSCLMANDHIGIGLTKMSSKVLRRDIGFQLQWIVLKLCISWSFNFFGKKRAWVTDQICFFSSQNFVNLRVLKV